MTTPSYYPPGWDAERWQTATDEEIQTLRAEDFERFHTGIRAHLGEDGAAKFFEEMHRRRAAAASPPESDRPPNFISALNQLRDEDGSFKEWGFVIYRTAGYDSDAIASDIKERIESDIDRQFNITWVSLTPDRRLEVQRAKEKFRLMWVEDADLNGATPEEVAR